MFMTQAIKPANYKPNRLAKTCPTILFLRFIVKQVNQSQTKWKLITLSKNIAATCTVLNMNSIIFIFIISHPHHFLINSPSLPFQLNQATYWEVRSPMQRFFRLLIPQNATKDLVQTDILLNFINNLHLIYVLCSRHCLTNLGHQVISSQPYGKPQEHFYPKELKTLSSAHPITWSPCWI